MNHKIHKILLAVVVLTTMASESNFSLVILAKETMTELKVVNNVFYCHETSAQ